MFKLSVLFIAGLVGGMSRRVQPLRDIYSEYLERLHTLSDGDIILIGNAVDPDRPEIETRTGQLIPALAALGLILHDFPLFGIQKHIYEPRFAYVPSSITLEEFILAEEEIGFIRTLQSRPGLVIVVMGQYPCRMLCDMLPNAIYTPYMTIWFKKRFRRPIYDSILNSQIGCEMPSWDLYSAAITKTIATPLGREQSSQTLKRKWQDPLFRARALKRNSQNGRNTWLNATAEWKKNKAIQSAEVGASIFKRKWQDPLFRARALKRNSQNGRNTWLNATAEWKKNKAIQSAEVGASIFKRKWRESLEFRTMHTQMNKAKMKKLWNSESFRQSKRKWYDDPQTREMMRRNGSEQLKRLRANPDFIEKFHKLLSQRQKTLWSDPAWRDKTRQAIKESWKKRRYDEVVYAADKRKSAIALQESRSRSSKDAASSVPSLGGSRLSCRGKNNLPEIMEKIKKLYAANSSIALVEVSHSLCIKPDYILTIIKGVRQDPNINDPSFLETIDKIEQNAGAGPRAWFAAANHENVKNLWSRGLSVSKIALLMSSATRSTDIMNVLEFSNMADLNKQHCKIKDKLKDLTQEDNLCEIAKQCPDIPVDRLIRVCSQTSNGTIIQSLYDKLQNARGTTIRSESSEVAETSLLPSNSLKRGLQQLRDAIDEFYTNDNNVGKLHIRWNIGYREARFVKDCNALKDHFTSDTQFLERLHRIQKQPQKSCKEWQDAVHRKLATYMVNKGFSLETISLLCHGPTRQEEVALALGYPNLKTAKQTCKAVTTNQEMVVDLLQNFPALDIDRVIMVCCDKWTDIDVDSLKRIIVQ